MKVGFPGEGRWDRMLGDLHPMTLSSIASLGLALGRAGDPAAAEPYCREAMEGYRRVLGDDHPDTLVSMGTLGAVLADLRRFAEPEPLAVKAAEGALRALGRDDPRTVQMVQVVIMLYANWHKVKTRKGYDAKAAQWRGKLPEVENTDEPDE